VRRYHLHETDLMDDETRDDKQPLTIAPGFLRGLKGERTEWPVVCKELIDNSLDANAKNISIRICDGSFVIDDDGEGCADLIAMESIGRSIKLKHTKSGMYGYGGVMAQIRISQGGDVKVESTSREWRSRVIIDFFECIENDRFETKGFQRRPSPPKVNTGTKITIEDAKPFYMKQRGDLIDNLSHSYSSALKRGKKIVVEINEEKTVLAPFNAPLPASLRRGLPTRYVQEYQHDKRRLHGGRDRPLGDDRGSLLRRN
jgi:hypothetical protein